MSINSQYDISISDLFKGDVQLSSPPNIYFELQKVIEDDNKSIIDAAFVIENDAALSARLLKIVNSAFYGFPSQVVSISRAVNLIGSKELQNIALSTIVIDRFSDLPGNIISMNDFWARSLKCALLAQEIDKFLGNQCQESIFICGILHNIGQLVMFKRIPELAREVYLTLEAEDNSSVINEVLIEKEIIGFDHFETGAALSKLWKLPSIITETIRLHAYPDNIDSYQHIAAIIRLADCYSKLDNDQDNIMLNNLGISTEDMSNIMETSLDKFDIIFQVFYS